MKLMNIENPKKFFDMIDACTGKVELVGEDIRINLKSKLAQIVSIANVFAGPQINELEIIAYNQDDVNRIIHFMMHNGEIE